MSENKDFNLQCPAPPAQDPVIQLAHGSGGKSMHALIEKVFYPLFDNPSLKARHDGAVLTEQGMRFAFTTDSYVIHPIFFPGGDIGSLAVYGTVNDLAMCGAKPLYLSAGFILEEGFSLALLEKIVRSMKTAADLCHVEVVTADTKVVDKGKGDGLYINTSGIGVIQHSLTIAPASVRAGDCVILSGDVGRHGMAVMAVREGLAFESEIQSDCAPLTGLMSRVLENEIEIHCMRDLTRGGLATALNEIARAAALSIHIEENKIPVREDVQGACEILGLDPFYVANEGRCLFFVPGKDGRKALEVIKTDPLASGAEIIGCVRDGQNSLVTMTGKMGILRILDMLSGEQLPRIC